jgi:plastocyanin
MSGRSRRQRQQQLRQRRVVATGVVAVLVVVAFIVIVVISSGGSSDEEPAAATNVISMIEMAFEPPDLEVAVDDARLRIVNDGKVPHSYIVPELGKGTPDLGSGQEMTLDLTDQEPGTYRVICDIPGHIEAGMVGTLTLR